MTEPRIIPWKRITVEAAAIVASILLAFAIDAWWDDRKESNSQSAELARIHAELSVVREQLNLEPRGRANSAVAQLLQMIQDHVDRTTPLEVPNELLGNIIAWGNFDVVTPVLDGVVLSGRLDAFESERVVTAITEWRLAISEIIVNEMQSREIVQKQLLPALFQRGNMAAMLARADPSGTTAIFVDDELEGHLALRFRTTRGDDRRLDSLRPILDDVLEAIDEALGT
jgi:hypothetical protein